MTTRKSSSFEVFESSVIIRKPRSTLYSHWLSVNLPILLLSVLSLADAKPNTLVEYVKRIGAVLTRNKGSDGKVSTRQLTSWRLWLMWLCWCDSVDWGYWLTMVKALYWQMNELLKHALLRLTRKSALDIETNSQVMDTLHCQSRTKVKVVKWC